MLRGTKGRRPPALVATLPAPIGGWNARDPMPAMKKTDAVILDNMIPGTGGVEFRNGYVEHVVGIANSIGSLMEYRALSGSSELFAAAGEYIYDVTGTDEIDPDTDHVVDGLTNSQFSHVLFENAGGHWLIAVNGANTGVKYNGAEWSELEFTGLDPAEADYVNVHGERLWFIKKNSLDVYYLDTDAIAGTATKFPLGAVAKLGGKLIAMTSWTRDGGSGSDDVAVFITSAGEVLLYSGTDPTDPDTFSLIGVFRIPEPVGRRCVVKSGADVGVITSQGALALSSVLDVSPSGQGQKAVTDKIKGAFAQAYRSFGQSQGWQIIEFPSRGLLLVNVPQPGGVTFHQYVMNTATGGWCRFKNINATVFSLMGTDLYFGTSSGTIYRMNASYEDDGEPIQATVLPAFNDFGTPGTKRFTMARPLFNAVLGTQPPVELRTEYQTTPITTFQTDVPGSGSYWNESLWNVATWGPTPTAIADWQMIEGYGRAASVVMSVASRNSILLNQIDIQYEPGGIL